MPPFRFFTDENTASGLQPGTGTVPQVGISDTDDNRVVETDFGVPWVIDPALSWINWRCTIEVELDPGLAVHKPLPQVVSQGNPAVDSLAAGNIYDDNFIAIKDRGVVTTSVDSFTDVVQKMATSSYTFILRGWALRVGYQVPIPGLVTVAGIKAIPLERQWAVNEVVGNYSGVPLFLAQWNLWYTVTFPPTAQALPPANLSQHLRADAQLPDEMQLPYSQSDSNSVPQQINVQG